MNGRVAKILRKAARKIAADNGITIERHPHMINSNKAPGVGKIWKITDRIDNTGSVRGIYRKLKNYYYACGRKVR